jgi:hypothetical protein
MAIQTNCFTLVQQEIEMGIVEGQSKNKLIKYTPFFKDNWYL